MWNINNSLDVTRALEEKKTFAKEGKYLGFFDSLYELTALIHPNYIHLSYWKEFLTPEEQKSSIATNNFHAFWTLSDRN